MAHSVKLSAIIQEYGLDLICTPEGYENVEITVADVNRPSLQLAGFYEYFDPNRIQLIGKVEYTYLESLSSEERFSALESLMKEPIPVVILTRNLEPFPELIACAELAQQLDSRMERIYRETLGDQPASIDAELG